MLRITVFYVALYYTRGPRHATRLWQGFLVALVIMACYGLAQGYVCASQPSLVSDAWLDDLSEDGAARAAFRPGEWNHYRIECLGPWIRTWVNGELRQNNSTAKMIWDCARLVEFFSTFVTLRPGVVIATGTPGGTAWGTDPELGGKKPMRKDVIAPTGYLRAGDTVVCEIEKIGRLENRVAAA